MINKKIFFESINKDTIFDSDFYKKVYGYSVYDNEFLDKVSAKLIEIGKKDCIQEYNDWFTNWNHERLYGNGKSQGLISISRWYVKICDEQYQELMRSSKKKREVKVDCRQRKKELLEKKKRLLQIQLQTLKEN